MHTDNHQYTLEQYLVDFSKITGLTLTSWDIEYALDVIENNNTQQSTTSQLLEEF